MSRLCAFGGCFGFKRRGLQRPAIPGNVDKFAKQKIFDLWGRTRLKINNETSGMIHVSAVDTVVGMLERRNNWVTITGNAGDGKTTLGLQVLKHFGEDVSVYCIEEPEEYRQLSKFTEDRIIMFDDRFGAFTSDQVLINKWKDVIADILRMIYRNETQTQIIFISRKNVVNEARDYLGHSQDTILDPYNVFDLSLIKKQNERLQILDYYLKKSNLQIDPDVKRRVAGLNIAHGFPHCAKMFPELRAKNQDLNMEDFFMTPLKFLEKTTTSLYNENCGDLFELLIKNDGHFDVNSLADKGERKKLLQVEREQEGSYITVPKNGVCAFAHPSIYESVLSVICNKDPLLCVQNASLSVIRQKINLTFEETPTQISVKPVKAILRALAERFRPEIIQGDYSVFSHRFSDNEDFCDELLAICVTSDVAAPKQRSRKCSYNEEDEASGHVAACSVTVQDSSQQSNTTALADPDALAHQILQHLAATPERGVVSHTQRQFVSIPDSDVASPTQLQLEVIPERGRVSHTKLPLKSIPERDVVSHSQRQLESIPDSDVVSHTHLQLESIPEREVVSHTQLQFDTTPERGGVSQTQLQQESSSQSILAPHTQLQLESTSERDVVSHTQPQLESIPEREVVSHTQRLFESIASSDVVSHIQLQLESIPEREVVSHTQTQLESIPDSDVVSHTQLSLESIPEREVVSHTQLQFEPTPERGGVSQTQLQQESSSQSILAPHTQLQLESTSETGVVSHTQPQLESIPEREVVSHSQRLFESIANSDVVSHIHLKLESIPEREVVSHTQTHLESIPDRDVVSHTKLSLESIPERDVVSNNKLQFETTPERGGVSQTQLQLESSPQRNVATYTQLQLESTSERDMVSHNQPQLESIPEREAGSHTQTHLESIPDRDVVSHTKLSLESIPERDVVSNNKLQFETTPERGGVSQTQLQLESSPQRNVATYTQLQLESTSERDMVSHNQPQLESIPEKEVVSQDHRQLESIPGRDGVSHTKLPLESIPERNVVSHTQLRVETTRENGGVSHTQPQLESIPEREVVSYTQRLFESIADSDVVSHIQLQLESSPQRNVAPHTKLQFESTSERGVVSNTKPQLESIPEKEVVSDDQRQLESIPDRDVVSHTQLQVETIPTNGEIAQTQLQLASTPEKGVVQHTQVQLESTPEKKVVSHTHPQLGSTSDRGGVSHIQLQLESSPGRGVVPITQPQLEPTPDRGGVSHTQLQLESIPERGVVQHAQLQVETIYERDVVSPTQLQLESSPERDKVSHTQRQLESTPERGVVSHTQLQLESTPERAWYSSYAVVHQLTLNVTQQQFGDVAVEADTIENMSLGGQQHIHQTPAVQAETQQDGGQGHMDMSKSSRHIDKAGKDDRTMLWTAVHGGRKQMIHALLEHGADINIPDGSGNTLLPYLCQQDQVDIEGVQLAIKKGADCNMVDETGNTQLLLLCCKQSNIDHELVKVLVKNGKPGSTNTKNRSGMTALHCLCGQKRVDFKLVRFLVTEAKGDINLRDDIGATPLHWLNGNNSSLVGDIKQLAVEGHGDMNIKDDFGFTPFHYLCARIVDMKSLVTLIQEVGGDVNLTDQQGNTPLHYISMTKKQSAEDLLKNIPGADIDIVNDAGISPRDYMLRKANTSKLIVSPPVNQTSEDLVIKVRNSKERWIPVRGRAMLLITECAHYQLEVKDRELTNMKSRGKRQNDGQFQIFEGTRSHPLVLPPPPSPLTSPSYWETRAKLRWKEVGTFIPLLEMGVVEGESNMDREVCVSLLPGSASVSLWDRCLRHPDQLCTQVKRKDDNRWGGRQLGECISVPLPSSGEEVTLTYGLVLDVGRGRIGFLDVEKEKLLGTIDKEFRHEIVPVFHVNPRNDRCATTMRLVSGREISVTDNKIRLIQQALSD